MEEKITVQMYNRHEREIRDKAIEEFVEKCKKVRGRGCILNWDTPYGITFQKIDEIAEDMIKPIKFFIAE